MVKDVIISLSSLASEDRKAKASTYHPTSMEVLGVSNPNARLVVREMRALLKGGQRKKTLDVCNELVDTRILECQLCAWWLLESEGSIIHTLSVREMNRITGTLDNWVSVDTFGTLIYGVLWQQGTITDLSVHQLLKSTDVWQRRLAIVATVALNTRSRGGRGDSARTIAICEKVVEERDDMVVKALSWALRSLIYWDRTAVEEFMSSHHDHLASRVRREVSHKLFHGTKN